MSLGRRLRQPRTILSLLLPIILLVLVFRVALNVDVGELATGVSQANPLLLLAAFIVFYAGFPLRGLRWARLLRGSGFRIGLKDATEILFLSWLVNCLVPAKLGDVYRAYLLKLNSHVSLSRTFGTVFIERILDLFAISVLGLAAGFWSFRNGLPTEIQIVFGIAVGVVIVLAILLLDASQFRPSDPRQAAGPASGRRVLRPLRGGRLRGRRAAAPAAARPADRAHLGDRGDAPLSRGRWPSATPTSSSVSRAPSSSR